jgi:lipopolysaccharide export system protein LptA
MALLFMVGLVLPVAAATPVKITADQFSIAEDAGTATFVGNVVVTRGDLTLTAEKVVVYYAAGGGGDVDRMVATGRVHVNTSGQKASGDTADFDPASQQIRLSGNVQVINAQGTMNGPELLIDLGQKSSTFSSGKGGRVSGVFTPK